MSLQLLSRKPDSGLGNLASSPADPGRNIDWVLLGCQIGLLTIGLFTIYSSTRFQTVDPYTYTIRQVIFSIVALVAMSAAMSVDYHWLKTKAAFFYGCCILSLFLVLAVGALKGGARLSFDVGSISVQPAEVTKVAVLLYLATYLSADRAERAERSDRSDWYDRSDQVSYGRFVRGLLLVGVPVLLVVLQPDLGSASVLVACAMGVLLVAGARVRYIALITTLAISTVAAAVVAGIVDNYQVKRFEALFKQNSTDEGLTNLLLQVRWSKRAISTGGLTGKGYLTGPITNQRNIPVQWSDFIFAPFAEQFGLIGTCLLLGLFALMLTRIWRIAHLSKDMLGTYICAGAFAMVLWHVFQNVGMTMGIMPVTGLPLPFVSYGGSSLFAFSAIMGIVQNVHMRRMR